MNTITKMYIQILKKKQSLNPIKKEHPISKLQVPRDKKLRKKKSAQSRIHVLHWPKNEKLSSIKASYDDQRQR